MRKDPVCLMDIDEEEATAKGLISEWHGQNQVFCSEECKQEFDANPEMYATEGQEFDSTGDEESDYSA